MQLVDLLILQRVALGIARVEQVVNLLVDPLQLNFQESEVADVLRLDLFVDFRDFVGVDVDIGVKAELEPGAVNQTRMDLLIRSQHDRVELDDRVRQLAVIGDVGRSSVAHKHLHAAPNFTSFHLVTCTMVRVLTLAAEHRAAVLGLERI